MSDWLVVSESRSFSIISYNGNIMDVWTLWVILMGIKPSEIGMMAIYWVYIYIYTRNAWALPRRCSVEVSHSQTNVDAISQNSYGKKKVLGNITLPPQLNLKFLWEKQQRY